MTKCLFDLSAEELIRNKDIVQLRLRELEIELLKQETGLWLTTDFKAEGCTNEKTRKAFVDNETFQLKEAIKAHKHSIEVVNDLLRLRLKEMEVNKQ
jgi:hypothetical protein